MKTWLRGIVWRERNPRERPYSPRIEAKLSAVSRRVTQEPTLTPR
jgi:hypothetical protein